MSHTRRMRRAYERNNREALIALAGQRALQNIIRPKPRFIPTFIWITILRIVIKA